MSTTGWCAGLNIPRNTFGYPSWAGNYRAGNCCATELRRVPVSSTADAQCVESLIVRNTLVSSKQLGGTLTLQGSGTSNPTFEAALCVKAGAQIQGLSEHGHLRVNGDSCMGGPLDVGTIYGPTTVTQNPNEDPVASVLVVDGQAEVDTLLAATTNTGDLNVAGVFTVDGLIGGPLANATAIGLFSAFLVSICDGAGNQVTGVAVGANEVLTTSVWNAATATNMTLAQAVTVVVPRPTGGDQAVDAVVDALSPTSLLAIVRVTGAFAFLNYAPIAGHEADEDSPPVGYPVIIGYGSTTLGSRGFTTGIVSDPAAQMFAEYTSLNVSVDDSNELLDGSTGAPVMNFAGKIIGLIQYGTANSDPGGSPIYATVAGGAKGRYLKYFVDAYFTNPVLGTYTLPVTTGVTGTGPIKACDRTTALAPGGVTTFPYVLPLVPADQYLFVEDTGFGTVRLGNISQNNPSYSDVVLKAADIGVSAVLTVHNAVPTTAVSISGATVFTSPYWSPAKGTPATVCATVCTTPTSTPTIVSTNFESSADPVAQFTQVAFTISGLPSMQAAPATPVTCGTCTIGEFSASFHGNTSDTIAHEHLQLVWGVYTAIDCFLLGFGGVMEEAWKSVRGGLDQSAANKIVVVGGLGLDGGTASTFSYKAIQQSSSAWGNTLDVSITPNGAGMQVLLTPAGTGAAVLTTTEGQSATWNIFDYQTNTCRGIITTPAAVDWDTGATTAASIVTSVAAPTRIY